MKFPLNKHRRPKHALLAESDIRLYFQQEEPKGAKRQALDKILELGGAAVQEHLRQLANEIDQLDEEERTVLSEHQRLLDVFSAIDQRETPACAKRDTISDPTGYSRYTTEWYLDERDFSVEERMVVRKIDGLRRRRGLLRSCASYLRGKAALSCIGLTSSAATHDTSGHDVPTSEVGGSGKTPVLAAEMPNVFRIRGKTVTIRFHGEEIPPLHLTKGLRYLAVLTANPDQFYEHPAELERAAGYAPPAEKQSPAPGGGQKDDVREVTRKNAGALGYNVTGQIPIDRASHEANLVNIKARISAIDSEIEEAEAEKDEARYWRLEDEKKELIKRAKAEKVIMHCRRELDPDTKRVKDRIWNVIRDALDNIGDVEGGAEIKAHFLKSLCPFKFPSAIYRPSPPIEWH